MGATGQALPCCGILIARVAAIQCVIAVLSCLAGGFAGRRPGWRDLMRSSVDRPLVVAFFGRREWRWPPAPAATPQKGYGDWP